VPTKPWAEMVESVTTLNSNVIGPNSGSGRLTRVSSRRTGFMGTNNPSAMAAWVAPV
jgi:hypothetical protein